MKYPYDLTAEVRAWHRARLRNRIIAMAGGTAFCALVGVALGALAAQGRSPIDLMGVVAITAWGSWSLHYLLTRH